MTRRPVEWAVAAQHREEGEGPSSGLAWAEGWAGYKKSQEKRNGLQKLFGPKMNWAPQQNFKFISRF
jgi:hypothetical protein